MSEGCMVCGNKYAVQKPLGLCTVCDGYLSSHPNLVGSGMSSSMAGGALMKEYHKPDGDNDKGKKLGVHSEEDAKARILKDFETSVVRGIRATQEKYTAILGPAVAREVLSVILQDEIAELEMQVGSSEPRGEEGGKST